jgi:hypothetical protein
MENSRQGLNSMVPSGALNSFTTMGTYMSHLFFELLKNIVSLPIFVRLKSEDMKN